MRNAIDHIYFPYTVLIPWHTITNMYILECLVLGYHAICVMAITQKLCSGN